MSDLIKELWTNTNMLLRYVLSGFVVLFVGWAADDCRPFLEDVEYFLRSPYPILILVPVIGFVLFSVHAVVCYSTYGFLAYRWANKRLRHGSWRQAWHEHLELFGKRWEARFRDRVEATFSYHYQDWAREQMFLAWASQTHFLYCCSWALVVTPFGLWLAGRDACPWYLMGGGVLLFGLAFWNDRRLAGVMADYFGRLGMTTDTEKPDKFADWKPEMHLSRFLHQDQLMWSRLQTLMAIQTAAIALALLVHKSPIVATTVMGFGLGISVSLCVLYCLDRKIREWHNHEENTGLGKFHQDGKNLGWWIFWTIAGLFLIADVLTIVGLWSGWFAYD